MWVLCRGSHSYPLLSAMFFKNSILLHCCTIFKAELPPTHPWVAMFPWGRSREVTNTFPHRTFGGRGHCRLVTRPKGPLFFLSESGWLQIICHCYCKSGNLHSVFFLLILTITTLSTVEVRSVPIPPGGDGIDWPLCSEKWLAGKKVDLPHR